MQKKIKILLISEKPFVQNNINSVHILTTSNIAQFNVTKHILQCKRVTTDIIFVLVFGVGAYIYIHTGIRRLSQSTILVVGWGEGGWIGDRRGGGGRSLLNFAHEERLERTRCVVPS